MEPKAIKAYQCNICSTYLSCICWGDAHTAYSHFYEEPAVVKVRADKVSSHTRYHVHSFIICQWRKDTLSRGLWVVNQCRRRKDGRRRFFHSLSLYHVAVHVVLWILQRTIEGKRGISSFCLSHEGDHKFIHRKYFLFFSFLLNLRFSFFLIFFSTSFIVHWYCGSLNILCAAQRQFILCSIQPNPRKYVREIWKIFCVVKGDGFPDFSLHATMDGRNFEDSSMKDVLFWLYSTHFHSSLQQDEHWGGSFFLRAGKKKLYTFRELYGQFCRIGIC